jgi:hypothetical protein
MPSTYSEVQMKKFLLVVCLFASSSAFAETAIWTGNKERVQTVSGEVKWNCEYKVASTTLMNLFWQEFVDACPLKLGISKLRGSI